MPVLDPRCPEPSLLLRICPRLGPLVLITQSTSPCLTFPLKGRPHPASLALVLGVVSLDLLLAGGDIIHPGSVLLPQSPMHAGPLLSALQALHMGSSLSARTCLYVGSAFSLVGFTRLSSSLLASNRAVSDAFVFSQNIAQ